MGSDLSGWTPRPLPAAPAASGRYVRVEAFDPATHTAALFDALGGPGEIDARLRWFGWPVLTDSVALRDQLTRMAAERGWHTMTFLDPAGSPCGMASFMRTDTLNGVTEVGAVAHGAAMARGPMSTEAHYLMARAVFDELGYRRYEWKLDDRNAPSHTAARRLGFTFEGVFRNHMVVRQSGGPPQNRDTAWYAITDDEWPVVRAAMERWLDPANHDPGGRQRRRLWEVRADL